MSSRVARGRVQCAVSGALTVAVLLAAGCGHKQKTAKSAPTAPSVNQTENPEQPSPGTSARIPVTEVPDGGVSEEDKEFVLAHRPIFSEEGAATWYTAPYKGQIGRAHV